MVYIYFLRKVQSISNYSAYVVKFVTIDAIDSMKFYIYINVLQGAVPFLMHILSKLFRWGILPIIGCKLLISYIQVYIQKKQYTLIICIT
ncbi:hypothetical protein C2G38_2081177 [Gigaspora rosea]|uniref:Uncharacterized protein n=1 Tax=Gigaspora rosea TaxID=44941 RepID=A0A397VCZ7_9GLOM|nr:hypothetical protein C2G38_2081177 [Gigaspora rosea]